MEFYNVCFTGHRKIQDSYYNPSHPTLEWAALKTYLFEVISTFYANGVRVFISGMAIGVDMLAAEVILKLKENHPDIQLHAAIPFPSQPRNWPNSTAVHYQNILAACDEKFVVNQDPYESWKMIARDKFMVDQSHYIIAVWDGRHKGGTYATTKYGTDKSRPIFRINPHPLSGNWLGDVT